jgi:hypothetical protein
MTRCRTDLLRGWSFFGIAAAILSFSGAPAVADEPKADGPESQAVLSKLEQKVGLGFQEQTPLWDVVNYMSAASSGPDDKDGKGFAYDFEGMEKAGKSRHSPIPIALEGQDVPIKPALQRVLKPMGLRYTVKKGVLMIEAEPDQVIKKP